ncbi:MAG: protein kinase domain-containing protein, partial [Blastocatellia bacterium]
MNPDHFPQVEQLYLSALDRAPDERAAFLDKACAGDDSLRREVDSMLAAHAEAGSFLARPAIGQVNIEEIRTAILPGAASSVGREISHYRILAPLGAGGMGEVFLAEDTRLRRKVALKILPAQFTHDPDRVRRFEQEAQAVSALNHPNILTLFEIGEAEQQRFLVTEYIDGQTLRQRLREAG